MGTNLTITGTTLNATGGVTITSTDNKLVRVDGTTGIQGSGITIGDTDSVSGVNDLAYQTAGVMSRTSKSNSTAYQAASDGFLVVIADGVTVGGSGTAELQTDSSNPPTTAKGWITVSNSKQSAMIPVKKGDYYRNTITTTSGTVNFTAEWVPLGLGG